MIILGKPKKQQTKNKNNKNKKIEKKMIPEWNNSIEEYR